MRGREKEREREKEKEGGVKEEEEEGVFFGDWKDGKEEEDKEEGLFVDWDKEDGGLFVDCVNWKGCVICFLLESFSISIPRFASFSILSPFSNSLPSFPSLTSFELCIGFNVPNRTDEHPNRKETARIGGPSSMDSWLQYAAPDP